MTLILTALCKNGICICADRRNKIWHKNGALEWQEARNDCSKIYKFSSISLIICNHGVNNFNGKSWKILCSDYEQSGRWKEKNLVQIVDDFKNFVGKDVLSRLESNKQNWPNQTNLHVTGFILCGKTSYDSIFEVFELFWSADGFQKKSWHEGLVGTGEGFKKYLEKYTLNDRTNTFDRWRSRDLTMTALELKRLFKIALEEQKRLSGDDFSTENDIKYIP